jgi:hypothetical protein
MEPLQQQQLPVRQQRPAKVEMKQILKHSLTITKKLLI